MHVDGSESWQCELALLVQTRHHVQPEHVRLPFLERRCLLLHCVAHCAAAVDRVLDAETVRETREALNMSRQVFAFKIGVNPRTLERWEQGRSKPNEQAAALLWLVRRYPDTLKRLEALAVSA